MEVAAVIAIALIAINLWATRRILQSDLDSYRKRLFVAAVWLVPLWGALVIKDLRPRSMAVLPPSPAAQRAPAPSLVTCPSATTPFVLAEHLAPRSGLPVLDWEAFRHWLNALDERFRTDAMESARKSWLLHLRDALGPHFEVRENDETVLLSSLDEQTAKAVQRHIATTRRRIETVLKGIAEFPAGHKTVVLVLDDEDMYYHYVSIYYPESGEFAFSGGMFVDAGCPHFVARRAELVQLEPVIAHELTHAALAHLHLPRWLDEGIAVNSERRIAGGLSPRDDPRQLHERLRRYWNAQSIQEFWTGRSFLRTDEGNALSYELARILVDQMSREWNAFAEFVCAVDRTDAGNASARIHLGMELGTVVCAILEQPTQGRWSPDSAQLGDPPTAPPPSSPDAPGAA